MLESFEKLSALARWSSFKVLPRFDVDFPPLISIWKVHIKGLENYISVYKVSKSDT